MDARMDIKKLQVIPTARGYRLTESASKLITDALRTLNTTMTQLCKETGIPLGTISQLINMNGGTKLKYLESLCKLLNFEIQVLPKNTLVNNVSYNKGNDISTTSSFAGSEQIVIKALLIRIEEIDKKLEQLDKVRTPLLEEQQHLNAILTIYKR